MAMEYHIQIKKKEEIGEIGSFVAASTFTQVNATRNEVNFLIAELSKAIHQLHQVEFEGEEHLADAFMVEE